MTAGDPFFATAIYTGLRKGEAKVLRPDLTAVVLLTKKVVRSAIGKGARDVLAESGLPSARRRCSFA